MGGRDGTGRWGGGGGGSSESQLIDHSTEMMSQGIVLAHVSYHKCAHVQSSATDTEGSQVVLSTC